MRRLGFYALVLGLAVASSIGGYYLYQLTQGVSAGELEQTAHSFTIGDRRPEFSLPDLEGQLHSVSQWDGKVLLINFWEGWCPPCVREIAAIARQGELDYAKFKALLDPLL